METTKHDIVGARYYKSDLHIHTPASKCWKGPIARIARTLGIVSSETRLSSQDCINDAMSRFIRPMFSFIEDKLEQKIREEELERMADEEAKAENVLTLQKILAICR